MNDEHITYRRKLLSVGSWRTFAVGHVAFVLHRLTGWLLLAWVGVHLLLPLLWGSPAAVYNPTSSALIVPLVAVLVFHAFNGIRLLIVELLGLTASGNRLSFWVSLGLSVLLILLMGVGL